MSTLTLGRFSFTGWPGPRLRLQPEPPVTVTLSAEFLETNRGAAHYRGTVTYLPPTSKYDRWMPSHPTWEIQVTNTRTKAVVVWDNGYGSLQEAMDACAREVWMVRHAWVRGTLRKRFL